MVREEFSNKVNEDNNNWGLCRNQGESGTRRVKPVISGTQETKMWKKAV
jgi:hypothetical protein